MRFSSFLQRINFRSVKKLIEYKISYYNLKYKIFQYRKRFILQCIVVTTSCLIETINIETC